MDENVITGSAAAWRYRRATMPQLNLNLLDSNNQALIRSPISDVNLVNSQARLFQGEDSFSCKGGLHYSRQRGQGI